LNIEALIKEIDTLKWRIEALEMDVFELKKGVSFEEKDDG